MSSLTPLVLEPNDLARFIQYVLDNHAPPSTLAVCSTKEVFLKQLHSCTTTILNTHKDNGNDSDIPDTEPPTDAISQSDQIHANPWKVPTLRLLASSRTIKLAFCPEVTHLRAYLATYTHQVLKNEGTENISHQPCQTVPILAILNPIQLHRTTSAFSAQGMNRTLSIAVEAAFRSRSRLILAECVVESETKPRYADEVLVDEEEESSAVSTIDSPWNEEVSILNVTTKTFGAGERGWVGRTVKIRRIAERWCQFTALHEGE